MDKEVLPETVTGDLFSCIERESVRDRESLVFEMGPTARFYVSVWHSDNFAPRIYPFKDRIKLLHGCFVYLGIHERIDEYEIVRLPKVQWALGVFERFRKVVEYSFIPRHEDLIPGAHEELS